MRYVIRGITEKPFSFKYLKSNQGPAYNTNMLQKYSRKYLNQQIKYSPLIKSIESCYIPRTNRNLSYKNGQKTVRMNSYLFPIAWNKRLNEKTKRQYLGEWKIFVCQDFMKGARNNKKMVKDKSFEVGFKLIELNTDGSHFEFLIFDIVLNRIVEWKDFYDIDIVQEYLKKHYFPKDKYYSKKEFLDAINNAEGQVRLLVEKRKTAEFICRLCCDLI